MDNYNLKSLVFDNTECLDDKEKFRAYIMDFYPEMKKSVVDAILYVYSKDIANLLKDGYFKETDIKKIISDGASSQAIKQDDTVQALKIWANTFEAETSMLNSTMTENENFKYDEFSSYIPNDIIQIYLECSSCGNHLDFHGHCPHCGSTEDIKGFFSEYKNSELFRKAMSEDPYAMYELGEKYYNDKNIDLGIRIKKARYWLEHAANKGLIKAWDTLSVLAQADDRQFSDDYRERFEATRNEVLVFTKGAFMGNAFCCIFLERLYFEGDKEFEADIPEGLRKMSTIAEDPRNVESVATANCILGQIYLFGKYGIKRDYERAYNYIQKAAEKHDDSAMYYLALCYEKGYGVLPNDDEALKYYRMAAQRGIEPAIEFVKKYDSKINEKVKCNIREFKKLKKQIENKRRKEEEDRKREEERIKKEKKEKAVKEYWENHAAEYSEIQQKIKECNEKIAYLLDLNSENEKNLIALKKERDEKTNEEMQYYEAEKAESSLREQLKCTPFYKFLLKRKILKTIEEQTRITAEAKLSADESRRQKNNEYGVKINNIQSEINKNNATIENEKAKAGEFTNYDPVGDNF